ncbi:hypothetical protein ACH5RR_028301 [Cinchona calisaya]|uniref:Kinesin motor domain-containing protein n=1 Tax=Cinchona calisaya TaxID=153742 RepID=A0ABD2YSB8_9GENT
MVFIIKRLDKRVEVEAYVETHEDLKAIFITSSKERKELYDKVLELKGNIRVFCRCRPLNNEDVAAGASMAIDFEAAKDGELTVKSNGIPKITFKFDVVFSPQPGQTSVLEVYNEQIRDLLVCNSELGSKRFEIKQVGEGMHPVPGLVEAREQYERGLGSPTNCIHCVMEKGENLLNGECTRSKLWLIDLAGSERIAKTEVQGGDSKTLMFVQISPNENDLSETLRSLYSASRVRGIELGPAKKQVENNELLRCKQMVEKTKQEIKNKDIQIKKLEDTVQGLDIKIKEKDMKNKNLQDKAKSPMQQHIRRVCVSVGMEKVRVSIGSRGKMADRVLSNGRRVAKDTQQKQSKREKEGGWNIGSAAARTIL